MNFILNIIIFILWPFGGFLYSLIRPINRLTYLFFAIFFFLIGSSFYLQNELADSFRYAENYREFCENGMETMFFYYFILLGQLDIYTFLTYSICSYISDNPRVLFGLYGAVFGIFVCHYYVLIKKDNWKNNNLYYWIFIFIIYLLNPHTNINGVRFWTATWMFFSLLISCVMFNKKKNLFFICLTPLIHTSYIIPLLLFLLSRLKFFKTKTIYIFSISLFIISFVFDMNNFINLLPSDFGVFSHFQAYLDGEYMKEIAQKADSRSMIYRILSTSSICFCLYILNKVYNNTSIMTTDDVKLLDFALLLFSFCSFFGGIPSVGRFYTLLYMITIYLLYRLYIVRKNKSISLITLLLFPCFCTIIYNNLNYHSIVINPIYIYGSLGDIISFSLSY